MLANLLVLASAVLAPATLAVPVQILDNPNNQLVYSARDNLCLSLIGGDKGFVYDGASVVSWPCDTASRWNINRGNGNIKLALNTSFSIDIGLEPKNGGLLKIWQTYDGAPQQSWYFTDDNRFANTGGDQCLDESEVGVKTYACTPDNRNQIWYTTSPSPGNNPIPETTLVYPLAAGATGTSVAIPAADGATGTVVATPGATVTAA